MTRTTSHIVRSAVFGKALVALGVLPVATGLAAFAQVSVTTLGGFASPFPNGQAFGVSADGSTVVGYSQDGFFQSAFRWTAAGGLEQLDALPAGSNAEWALDVSDDGSIVVGWNEVGPSPNYPSGSVRPVFWDATGSVQELPLPGSLEWGRAQAVSADGQVACGYAEYAQPAGASLPLAWNQGVLEVMPAAPGETGFGRALDISNDGSTVVGFVGEGLNSAINRKTFVWTRGVGTEVLVPPPGWSQCEPVAVSGNGDTIVGTFHIGSNSRGLFRWTCALGFEQISLGTGFVGPRYLTDISDDGTTIIGYELDQQTGARQARIYSQGLGFVGLREHLMGLNAAGLDDLTLTRADAISADGSRIVGRSQNDISLRFEPFSAALYPGTGTGPSVCAPAVVNSTGSPAILFAVGTSIVSFDWVELTCSGLPPQQFGFFVVGSQEDFVPGAGGSQGALCVGGRIGRFIRPGEVRQAGPGGRLYLRLRVANVPTPTASESLMPSDTRTFQFWYRDMNPGATSNFTNATTITFR